MPSAILDGLLVADATGLLILATTTTVLGLAVVVTLFIHMRYARIERDLKENGGSQSRFSHDLLNRIVHQAEQAFRRVHELNTQAIIEDNFQAGLKPLLLAERFVKASTGLVIILGLLGTFYGLTLSIGRLVHLVSGEPGGVSDVTQAVTRGLTHALSGMAVAFSNSLFGISSAVVLTVLGVFANVTDRRVALMVQLETYLDRLQQDEAIVRQDMLPIGINGASGRAEIARIGQTVVGFGESVARLEGAVARFESALQAFAGSTREFLEFNSHLKDNVQRMSLSFGDFSETLRGEVAALKSRDSR